MYTFLSFEKLIKKSLIFIITFVSLIAGLIAYDRSSLSIKPHANFDPLNGLISRIEQIEKNREERQKIIALLGGIENTQVQDTNSGHAKSIPVLLYHGIIMKPDGINVPISDFERQMAALKKNGWQTVSLDDFISYSDGQKELPIKSFLLTFDDGRRDTFKNGDPVLAALNYRATMFIITGRTDKSPFHLSSDEIREMAQSGRWDFGSHTRNSHDKAVIDATGNQGYVLANKLYISSKHANETDAEYQTRINDDLRGAQSDLKTKYSINAQVFAYPFGDFGQENLKDTHVKDTLTATVQKIYKYSFIQAWFGAGDFFNKSHPQGNMVKRLAIDSSWNEKKLLDTLKIGEEKDLPFEWQPSDTNIYLKGWGEVSATPKFLRVNAVSNTKGADAFINGDSDWQDYIFSAHLSIPFGKSFSLIVGNSSSESYACDFSTDGISLVNETNNDRYVLFAVMESIPLPRDKETEAKVIYSGNTITCYLDNLWFLKYNLQNQLPKGGIGLSVYDPRDGVAELDVSKVSVASNPR